MRRFDGDCKGVGRGVGGKFEGVNRFDQGLPIWASCERGCKHVTCSGTFETSDDIGECCAYVRVAVVALAPAIADMDRLSTAWCEGFEGIAVVECPGYAPGILSLSFEKIGELGALLPE